MLVNFLDKLRREQTREQMQRLLEIMAQLRDPEQGCPWDREQTFKTIAPYTVEEAYEVADAIERGDLAHLREELGDLLLQVVYHARMAEEQGLFVFEDVARGHRRQTRGAPSPCVRRRRDQGRGTPDPGLGSAQGRASAPRGAGPGHWMASPWGCRP